MDSLDHRLLAQQVTKRLGDQVGEPIDLPLGRPRQELLHHDPRLAGDPRHALPVVLGKFLVRLPLADRLEPRLPGLPVRSCARRSHGRVASPPRSASPSARLPRGAARETRPIPSSSGVIETSRSTSLASRSSCDRRSRRLAASPAQLRQPLTAKVVEHRPGSPAVSDSRVACLLGRLRARDFRSSARCFLTFCRLAGGASASPRSASRRHLAR